MLSIVKYIRDRLNPIRNQNFIGIVVGPTGSGKSFSTLRLCELVDPNFSIENVAFTPLEFMRLLNSGKLKRGSAICFDEVGVAMNSRKFQSLTNEVLNYTVQTFRSNNYCTIFTAPSYNFVDLSIRKMCHAMIETTGIDYENKLSSVKIKLIQNNPQSDKAYMKYPRLHGDGFTLHQLEHTNLQLPSSELLKAYEAKKEIFNAKLQSNLLNKLENEMNPPPKPAPPDLLAIAQLIQQNPDRYSGKRGGLNVGTISQDFKIGRVNIERLRGLL
jgi:hypothetical protein